jgi:glutathione synthase/RimK-type ligase-like ATP-grasp enzyme
VVVLILDEGTDPQLPMVRKELDRRGADYRVFDTNEPYRHGLSFGLQPDYPGKGVLRTRDGEIAVADITSVWAGSSVASVALAGIDRRTRRFMETEWETAFSDLYLLTRDRFWMNPLDSDFQTMNRLHQLRCARTAGFEVPSTLITTNAREFQEFVERFPEGVASKKYGEQTWVLHESPTRAKKGLYTHRLRATELTERMLARVKNCPCLLQEYVPKRSELRIYVVGTRVFAAEILSQATPLTATDWKHYPVKILEDGTAILDASRWRCRKFKLPPSLEQHCLALAKRLRLTYTAIDVVRTPDDRYVFLEANYGGVFAWIEEQIGLPISGAIADALVDHR